MFNSTSVPQLPVGPQGQGRGGGRGHGRGRAIEIHPPRTEPQQNIDRIISAEHRQQSPSPTRESPPLQPPLPLPHQHQPPHAIPVQLPLQDVHMLRCTLSIILEVESMFVNIVRHYIGMRNDLRISQNLHRILGCAVYKGRSNYLLFFLLLPFFKIFFVATIHYQKAFLQDIRQYNAALAFTSLAVKVDEGNYQFFRTILLSCIWRASSPDGIPAASGRREIVLCTAVHT